MARAHPNSDQSKVAGYRVSLLASSQALLSSSGLTTQKRDRLVFSAALGVHEPGSHVVSDHLHFVGSQDMYVDLSKRGVEVTWVKMKEKGIPLEDLDRGIW